jgi:protocatechuate 3,4-dioxygenase beta subunit
MVVVMDRATIPTVLALGILSGCAAPSAGAGTAAPRSSPSAATSISPAIAPGGSCSKTATVAQTEGPYFKSGSPEAANLVQSGMTGTRLTLSGRVLGFRCSPVRGAILDFWQADASGAYDNTGYRLRGHQAAGVDGAYHLDTIIPGLYPGRTEHIHVKVTPPGGRTLTTQLYFPGVARNQQDGTFDSSLLVDLRDGTGGKTATFDFVLGAA